MKTKHQSVQRASNMLWRRTSSPGCHGVILPYVPIETTANQLGHLAPLSAPNSVLTTSLAEPPGSCVVTIPNKNIMFTLWLLHQILLGNQIKKHGIVKTCNVHGRDKKPHNNFSSKKQEVGQDHFGRPRQGWKHNIKIIF